MRKRPCTSSGTAANESNIGSDYTDAQTEWLRAVDAHKRYHGPVLSAEAILGLALSLGYRRRDGTADPAELARALDTERRRMQIKRRLRGRHLTACEVLEVLERLGYTKEG